jgi:chromosome partitioning protein
MSQRFTVQKILKMFPNVTRDGLIKAENAGLIPKAEREGASKVRIWGIEDVPAIGERYGFMKKPQSTVVLAYFTRKGGVLKTTNAYNLARTAALHNIKTVLIGLDPQCDLTMTMGYDLDLENVESLEEALKILGSIRGLPDFQKGTMRLDDIILESDIPTLHYIPETPDLFSLEEDVSKEYMRDTWLDENVIKPLKDRYDLIILDCPAAWSILISNALMACDMLISPLECKIVNLRNVSVFKVFVDNFQLKTKKTFERVYIPTKHNVSRKLSTEIKSWFQTKMEGCISGLIRESGASEDAMASYMSLLEFEPSSLVADEMRQVILEVWSKALDVAARKFATQSALHEVAEVAARSKSSSNKQKPPKRSQRAAGLSQPGV